MPDCFAAAAAVMYHGSSVLQRQRITEWHQQGSSQGGKHQAVGLMAKVAFFVIVAKILLKLELNISFCVGLQFKCTSAV